MDKINRIADDWIVSRRAAGTAVVITQDQAVVYASGFGVQRLPNGPPVTAGTPFRIGSVTKQFTAAAILRLAQQGRLSLGDHLSKYIPTFPDADNVTLYELLTHTSGIHNYTDALNSNPLAALSLMRAHTTAQWVDHIARQRPLYDFLPGTAWHYSNSGFFLLGAIVEKVSGQPLAAYLQDQFFDPLGMNETEIDDGSDAPPGRAEGYAQAPWFGRWFVWPGYISLTNAGGAGALRSSAMDLAKWMQALIGGRVVDAGSLQEMMTPARLSDGRLASANRVNMDPSEPAGDYGFGIRIMSFDGHRQIGHDGDIPGFQAALFTYPDDRITIAVVANTSGGARELEQRIAKVVLAANPPASGRPGRASAPVPRS
ncbi:MAG TPA: serine hydrolase domain-containing protein [Caulobacteraceae bacterium]|jgi:CubicO group peptidase (beta-lactamase class C family)|nr:serine hydrolase domain-containing protein [Caulobacteraceae bacterium]